MDQKIRRVLCGLLAVTVMAAGLWRIPLFASAEENSTEEIKSDSAANIRLMETEGTVYVTDSVGSALSMTDRMRLYSGNHVETKVKSYAMMALDDAKVVKLDALSKSEIRKNGKKLQVLLEAGNLFFDVSKPLEEEETYHIRTSTMVMGIRGTCGIVNEISPTHTRVAILEGEVECIVSNPATGVEKMITVHAGEIADFVVFPPEEKEEPEETSEIYLDPVEEEDIGGFAMLEICETEGLAEKILMASGLDLTAVTPEQAQEKIAADEEKLDTALVAIDQAVAEQNSNILVQPVWPGGDAASDASTEASDEEEPEEEEATAEAGAGSASTGATANAATGSSKTTTNAATGSNASTGKSVTSAATGATSAAAAATTSGSSGSASRSASTAASEASTASSEASTGSSQEEGTGHRLIIDDGITGGTVKTEKKRAEQGSEVKITVTPDSGKKLKKLTCQSYAVQSGYEVFSFDIIDSGAAATYTMTMGWDEDVLIKAVFE